MSRSFTSLALSASLLLMSSAVFAKTTDPVCALVDVSLLTALQLGDVQAVARKVAAPVPGGGTVDVPTCAWGSKKVQGQALTVSSMPFPGAMPVSCNTQQLPDKVMSMTMTMCMAAANGSMLTVMWMQKADKSDPKVVATLRSHTEAMAAKLGKTVK
jgi:hypothetical protein